MIINITVKKGRLQEIRGRKTFWSEVVFEEGYSLAPTYTLADIRALDQFLTLQPQPQTGLAWPHADPATEVLSQDLFPLISRRVVCKWDEDENGNWHGAETLAA